MTIKAIRFKQATRSNSHGGTLYPSSSIKGRLPPIVGAWEAAFVCAHLGLTSVLKVDNRAIFKARIEGQQATDWLVKHAVAIGAVAA
jgi:hypothetical protein